MIQRIYIINHSTFFHYCISTKFNSHIMFVINEHFGKDSIFSLCQFLWWSILNQFPIL